MHFLDVFLPRRDQTIDKHILGGFFFCYVSPMLCLSVNPSISTCVKHNRSDTVRKYCGPIELVLNFTVQTFSPTPMQKTLVLTYCQCRELPWCTVSRACIHTHTNTHTHTHSHTKNTHPHTYTPTHIHIHIHTHTYTHTNTHTQTVRRIFKLKIWLKTQIFKIER